MNTPRSASKIQTHTYVPVTAGIAQAAMIALDTMVRQTRPSEASSTATAVPKITVRDTDSTAKATVFGSTTAHSCSEVNTST